MAVKNNLKVDNLINTKPKKYSDHSLWFKKCANVYLFGFQENKLKALLIQL